MEHTSPTAKAIMSFFHCRRCLNEIPPGHSPETWAKNSVGWTEVGIQVWCDRHDCNVVHIDFKGQKVAYFMEKPNA